MKKEWKHVYGNTFTYQKINNKKYIVLRVTNISGIPHVTLSYPGSPFDKIIWQKEFKFKSHAIKFAKQYMETN